MPHVFVGRPMQLWRALSCADVSVMVAVKRIFHVTNSISKGFLAINLAFLTVHERIFTVS